MKARVSDRALQRGVPGQLDVGDGEACTLGSGS